MRFISIFIMFLVFAGCEKDPSKKNNQNNTNNANNTNNINNANNTNNVTLDIGILTFETGGVPVRTGGDPLVLTDTAWDEEYTATVSFDALQAPSHALPPGIGGINMEVQFGGFNVMSGFQLDPEVAQQLNGLRLEGKTIRWPGGGYDTLDYSGCIGHPQNRPQQNFFGFDQQCTFGPAEASSLAQITGSELWMQVQPMLVVPDVPDSVWVHGAFPVYNHNSGDPDTLDAPVANWQIGNEQFHLDSGEYSAMDFVNAALLMIPAMRHVDPAIKIWVPLFLNYANNFFSAQSEWNRTIIENLASMVDGFTVHNGYSPVVPNAATPQDVADAYRAMFSNALWARKNLEDLRALILQHAPGEADRLQFAITEMNATFGIFPADHNMMNHVQTLASGAYFASMLGMYALQGDVTHVHAFTGVQFTSMGLLGVTDGTFTSKPDTHSTSALVLREWNDWAYGEVLTNVEVTAPVFQSRTLGWMQGHDAIPLLQAFVVKSGEDSSIKIMFVNRSLTESARVQLQIAGMEFSDAVIRIVTGLAPDSNPGLTIPEIVSPVLAAEYSRFHSGVVGEIWIRSEAGPFRDSIRIPPTSVVFMTLE